MSTGSGIPVTRILVSGCTTNFKPLYRYFIFYPINVIFVFSQNIFFTLKSNYQLHFIFDTAVTAVYRRLPPSGGKQEKLNFVTNKKSSLFINLRLNFYRKIRYKFDAHFLSTGREITMFPFEKKKTLCILMKSC